VQCVCSAWLNLPPKIQRTMQTNPNLSKNLIQNIRSLDNKKFRKNLGLFVAEGAKCIAEIEKSSLIIKYLISADPDFVSEKNLVTYVSKKEFEKISHLTTPQGILAVAELPEKRDLTAMPSSGNYLLLDQIQDPGNLGTIIRIALWFGFDGVWCMPGTADAYSPKAVQASMGALFHIPVLNISKSDFLLTSELPLFGMDLDGANLFQTALPKNAVYVMGSEGNGISAELCKYIRHWLHIPGSGQMESLNVGVAAGILCAEVFRKT
jgi:RNA methyltransferase, TrmH family